MTRRTTCHECGARIGSAADSCEVCWHWLMCAEVDAKADREDAYAADHANLQRDHWESTGLLADEEGKGQ